MTFKAHLSPLYIQCYCNWTVTITHEVPNEKKNIWTNYEWIEMKLIIFLLFFHCWMCLYLPLSVQQLHLSVESQSVNINENTAGRVFPSVHPPNPLQSFPWLLSCPVNIVVFHVKPRYDTWHLHCLSRCFHLRGRLVQFDLTPNSWKQRKQTCKSQVWHLQKK